MAIITIIAFAQKDVTKFLGIPVDGYKNEMKQKLLSKGFTYDSRNDCFDGEFNGSQVTLSIVTNNNKVWRIALFDKYESNETDIRIRFNNLCRQFGKNKKYIPVRMGDGDYIISEDEDISYNMSVKSKRYEAAYYQDLDPKSIDSVAIRKIVVDELLKQYTQEQIDTATEEQAEDMRKIAAKATVDYIFELMEKKSVWFMISESFGKYRIFMYYDNEYNHSDGEDL